MNEASDQYQSIVERAWQELVGQAERLHLEGARLRLLNTQARESFQFEWGQTDARSAAHWSAWADLFLDAQKIGRIEFVGHRSLSPFHDCSPAVARLVESLESSIQQALADQPRAA